MGELQKVNWSSVPSILNIHDQLDSFVTLVNEIFCKKFLLKVKLVGVKLFSKPWLTSGILRASRLVATFAKYILKSLAIIIIHGWPTCGARAKCGALDD